MSDDVNVIPFRPLSGTDLVTAARMARAVPPKPTPPPHLGGMPRADRLRALAGVAQALIIDGRTVLQLIADGVTADGPLSIEDIRDLARMALIDLDPNILPAMVGDIEAIHGQ